MVANLQVSDHLAFFGGPAKGGRQDDGRSGGTLAGHERVESCVPRCGVNGRPISHELLNMLRSISMRPSAESQATGELEG